MGMRASKGKQIYIDHPRYRSKLTCLIHGPGHSSDECRVINYFDTKYEKCRPFK